MVTITNKIKKIGNGHFLPLSAATMDALQLRAGQQVTLSTHDGTLVVRTVDDDYAKRVKQLRGSPKDIGVPLLSLVAKAKRCDRRRQRIRLA